MGKTALITAGALLAAGVALFSLLGSGERDSAIAGFQARLVAARDGRAAERLLEGTVRVPAGHPGAMVASATWTQVRAPGTSNNPVYFAEKLRFGFVPFELETREGVLVVDGELRGVSDLIRRERGPAGDMEVKIVTGDRVSVLGPITERDGKRGFFGPVVVVRGTFDEWHAIVAKASVASLPDQP